MIGRSGAGKSTLLRLLNGLVRPSHGRAVVDGVDIGRARGRTLRDLRRRVAMVHQHFNLLSARTAAGNVALPLEFQGVAKAEVRDKVAHLLDLVGLSAHADKYPAQLSGGQKQRVGIARALAVDPRLLLCDEITSALDPETTRQILRLIDRLRRELGLTVVLITHEMSVVRQICERVAVLDDGRVVEAGPVREVLSDPRHPVTQSLVSSEEGDAPRLRVRLRPGAGAERALLDLARSPELTLILQRARDGRLAVALDGTPEAVRGAAARLAAEDLIEETEDGHDRSAAAAA